MTNFDHWNLLFERCLLKVFVRCVLRIRRRRFSWICLCIVLLLWEGLIVLRGKGVIGSSRWFREKGAAVHVRKFRVENEFSNSPKPSYILYPWPVFNSPAPAATQLLNPAHVFAFKPVIVLCFSIFLLVIPPYMFSAPLFHFKKAFFVFYIRNCILYFVFLHVNLIFGLTYPLINILIAYHV